MKRIAWVISLALLTLPVAAQAAESAPAAPAGVLDYARLMPISFSVIGPDNKIDEEVSVQLGIEMAEGKPKEALDRYKRQIMNAFLLTLNEAFTGHKPEDPPVGGDELKAKLLAAATDIVGPGVINQILILSIGERRHAR